LTVRQGKRKGESWLKKKNNAPFPFVVAKKRTGEGTVGKGRGRGKKNTNPL